MNASTQVVHLCNIDPLPSGKHRVRLQRRGEILTEICDSPEEAVRMREALKEELRKHVLVDKMSLAHLGDDFMRNRRSNYGYRSEKGRWSNHLAKASFAARPLMSVMPRDVYSWLDELRNKPNASPTQPKAGLSRQTRKHCLNLLRAFFEWARQRGYVTSNPCTGVVIQRENGDEDEGWSPDWFLDPANQTGILKLCVRFGGEEAPLAKFSLGSGLRFGEQFSLHVEDLHSVGRRPCRCQVRSNEPHVLVRFGSWDPRLQRYRPPKGKKGHRKQARIVPLFGHALDAIHEWLPVLERRENPHGLLFPSPAGGRYSKAPKWFTEKVARKIVVRRLGCQFAPPCRHPSCRVMPPEERAERPIGRMPRIGFGVDHLFGLIHT